MRRFMVVFNYFTYSLGGSWKLEVGSWKLEVGSWKLEVGSSKAKAIREDS
jgi:hypothetical protein